MRTGFTTWVLSIFLVLSSVFTGCKKTFEASPYTSDIPAGYTDLNNATAIQKIRQLNLSGKDSFKVAFLSDTHSYLDDLHTAVDKINEDPDVLFAVVVGDLSERGLEKEYMFYYDEIKRLNKPVISVIGNHDYLANAEYIYDQMFGDRNFVMDFGGYRFIFWDNVFWESNKEPDFDWMNKQASAEGIAPVLISHIPPYADQYTPEAKARHEEIVKSHNMPVSIHGHLHGYYYGEHEQNGINYLVVPSAENDQYCVLSFSTKTPGLNVALKGW